MLNLEQQIFKQIEKSKHILLIFSKDQGGDYIATALALFVLLKKESYLVDVVGQTTKENNLLSFLPNYNEIQSNFNNLRRFIISVDISQAKVSQIKYSVDNARLNFIISPSQGWFKKDDVTTRAGEFKYDLIITIGVSNLETLGILYDQNIEFFYKTTIINIDNKPNNEDFGQINFIDLNAVTVSEIVFYLLKNYRANLIDDDIATCLLAGIIQKTKNFKNTNLTPRTLLTSSELISYKARREEIITSLYRSRSIKTLKLWGRFLNNLHSENKEELIWLKLTPQDFQESDFSLENLTDIIDELLVNVPQTSVVIIFYEKTKTTTQLIIYSLKNIKIRDLFTGDNPHGDEKIASWLINQDIKTASSIIIPDIKNKLEKLKS